MTSTRGRNLGILGFIALTLAVGLTASGRGEGQNVSSPTRTPYQMQLSRSGEKETARTTPRKVIFVIQQISVTGFVKEAAVQLTTTAGGQTCSYQFPTYTTSYSGGPNYYFTNTPVRMYSDPESVIKVELGSRGTNVTLSGYLVSPEHFLSPRD